MRRFCFLILLLDTNNAVKDEKEACEDIVCHHDNVRVCGVRGGGSKEITFRQFQDECALQKYGCQEGEIKDFKLINIEFCKQAFSLDASRSSAHEYVTVEETDVDGEKTNSNTTGPKHDSCIQCTYTSISKKICAIRPEGDHFIIRWFADECRMLQFNCENNLQFSVTDDYICIRRSNSENPISEETHANKPTEIINEVQDREGTETEKVNTVENPACNQDDCIPNFKVICALRPEKERFIVRWFDDQCDMLKYNCENHVNFTVTDDFICIGNDSSAEVFLNSVESQPEADSITDVSDTTELSVTEESTKKGDLSIQVKSEEAYNEHKRNYSKRPIPDKVVVTTFDLREDINQTVNNFFAASHTTRGIQLQKLENEKTRRVIVKDTGPISIYVPRTLRPANYTPVSQRNISEAEKKQFTPLVQYCFHKCPKKCPDFYRPVCSARNDENRQTPFLIFKNHCYMDFAKCMTSSYQDINQTSKYEEMGFVFCGGYRIMNTMYMFPLIRILQKMGRLKKKGKVHFVMRNLGQSQYRLLG